jgi:hypothetical protein
VGSGESWALNVNGALGEGRELQESRRTIPNRMIAVENCKLIVLFMRLLLGEKKLPYKLLHNLNYTIISICLQLQDGKVIWSDV